MTETSRQPRDSNQAALRGQSNVDGKRRIKLLIIVLVLLWWAAPFVLIKLYPEQMIAWFISVLPLTR